MQQHENINFMAFFRRFQINFDGESKTTTLISACRLQFALVIPVVACNVIAHYILFDRSTIRHATCNYKYKIYYNPWTMDLIAPHASWARPREINK